MKKLLIGLIGLALAWAAYEIGGALTDGYFDSPRQ